MPAGVLLYVSNTARHGLLGERTTPRDAGFLNAAHSPRRVAAWREAYFYGILVAAVFVPFDFLYAGRLELTLSARGALIGVLVACWWLLRPPAPRVAGRIVFAGAVLAGILTPATVLVSSGTSGSRFGFVLAVPFIVLALLPEVPAVAALSGVSAAVAGAIGMIVESRPPALVAEWLIMTTAITGVTAFGSRRIRALADRAHGAERERRDVLVQLEESERRRAASERLALVGRLASGIGHEINNPLSAVKGNLSCALEELERSDATPPVREALAEALAAAERIAWITADMRALTSHVGAPMVRCDVAETIRDALKHADPRLRHAKVLLEIEPGLPPIRSEPRLLAYAIAQLAAQAAAAPGDEPIVRIAARRVQDGIEIVIDDEGPQMPAHILQRVFEPFGAQGEVRGAGLGLALPMTRELAERSGGRVDAQWHGCGNRYTVTLASCE